MSSRPVTGFASAVDAEGLTSEWLSAALGQPVSLRGCERIGTGQIAAAYRLTLEGDGLPATLVAKVNNGDEAARQRVWDGCRAEVGYYADLAHTVDGIRDMAHVREVSSVMRVEGMDQ